MLDSCEKHPHERGAALCRRCGHSWCGNCLVYAFGPKKPPFCMNCAMYAGGVRSNAARPAMTRRQIKAQERVAKAEAKAAAKAAKAAPKAPADDEVEVEAAFADTDWSTPWWEDRQPTPVD